MPIASSKVPPPPPATIARWVRLSQLASELGVDPRTLKKHLAGQPFVERLGSHVTLVDRGAFESWRRTRRR